MAWTDDFWGVISGGGWAAMQATSGGGDVQPALTPEASQAAWEGLPEGSTPKRGKFADAPVSGSADDKPKILGYEDIPGFDPETFHPSLVSGKKVAKGNWIYKQGDELTEWDSMSEEEINGAKMALYKAGYYGNKVPISNGLRQQDDFDAMKKAMSDANRNGLKWDTLLLKASSPDGGVGAEARDSLRQQKATMASAVTSLRGFAYENGIRLPNDFIKRKAEQIATGKVTEDELRNHMVNKFVARAYPTLAEDVKAGMTVRDAAAPYIASYAALLEVPESQVDLQDPMLKQALQHTNDKGEPADLPIWKFEEALKKDKRWQYTDNAWEEVGSQAYEVMKMFGYAS